VTPHPQTTAATPKSVVVPIVDGLTKEEKDAIISKIKVIYEGDHLSTETIEQISDAIAQYCVPDYAQLAKEERAGN